MHIEEITACSDLLDVFYCLKKQIWVLGSVGNKTASNCTSSSALQMCLSSVHLSLFRFKAVVTSESTTEELIMLHVPAGLENMLLSYVPLLHAPSCPSFFISPSIPQYFKGKMECCQM